MKFITATTRQVLCNGFLKFYCCVKERLLMRIFRLYCPYRLQLRFLRENAAFTSWYIRRTRLVTDGVLIQAECISQRRKKKLNPRGKRSLVFRGATRRQADMFALNEERNARVRSMRDCAFHYTTLSECIEYVIGVTCLYYCVMHLNTSIYIYAFLSLSLSLHEIYFLKMLHIIRSNLKLHTYSLVFSQVYRIQLILNIAVSCFRLASFS